MTPPSGSSPTPNHAPRPAATAEPANHRAPDQRQRPDDLSGTTPAAPASYWVRKRAKTA